MMFVPLIICVMRYVLCIETRSRHEETRPRHVKLHNYHHHQLIPTDLIPGSNHKGDLQQKARSKSKGRMTFSTTRKHSSRMRTARLPTIACFDGHETRCCPVQWTSLNRSLDVTSRGAMAGELGWGWGEPYTVRSNTSWLMLTLGSPLWTDRQILWKHYLTGISLAGGN